MNLLSSHCPPQKPALSPLCIAPKYIKYSPLPFGGLPMHPQFNIHKRPTICASCSVKPEEQIFGKHFPTWFLFGSSLTHHLPSNKCSPALGPSDHLWLPTANAHPDLHLALSVSLSCFIITRSIPVLLSQQQKPCAILSQTIPELCTLWVFNNILLN